MKNRRIVILVVVSFLLIVFSFNYIKVKTELSKSDKDTMKEVSLKKRLLMENQLRSKNLKILDRLIPATDLKENNDKIILLYTGFDCSTCVKKAFELVKKIQDTYSRTNVFIIASNTNIGHDQLANQYYDFIYFDKNEEIRRYLKFIYTPVFLSVDNNFDIKDVYFPNVFDEVGKNDFLKNIKPAPS